MSLKLEVGCTKLLLERSCWKQVKSICNLLEILKPKAEKKCRTTFDFVDSCKLYTSFQSNEFCSGRSPFQITTETANP